MEGEIYLAHFTRKHYIILGVIVLFFLICSIIVGIVSPAELSPHSYENKEVIIRNNTQDMMFELPEIGGSHLDLMVAYYQKVNVTENFNNSNHISSRQEQTIEVTLMDPDDPTQQEKQNFTFWCTFRNNKMCGKVKIIEHKLYNKGRHAVAFSS